MRVLIINIDKNIFEPNSASLERLKSYAGFCEKMKVIVLTLQKFPPIIEGNLEVFATGSSFRLKYFFDVWVLTKKIFKREKMDLVMTQDPFETGLLGWLIKRKYKLPWQCQIHGDIFSPFFGRESFINKLRVLLAKFLLPRADGIRVVSERIKQSLLSNVYNLKTIPLVLPIFVDVEKFRSAEIKTDLKQKYPQFDFLILAASRLSREKNIDMAIAALAEISKKYPKTGLVIVGEGKEKVNLQRLVKAKNLEKNVIFEPWSSDLASYYKTADAFLLTSNYEGWGMTIVEAAACACPIIMTDVGCAGELIKDGESGLIIKVGNEEILIGAVEKLIQDRNLGQRLGETAQKAVLSFPGEKQYLDSYKKSFTCLI
jgi:glycosyltransferase involved in cell wall biosynthesis